MNDTGTQRIVAILGPTAGGKSALAVGLARALGGEIVSADSMQVYRHLNAGTAKPTGKQRAAAPHWLIDIIEPTESFTAADWLQRSEGAIAEIHRRGKRPIVVGGTNLYLKALLEGLFEGPGPDHAFRASVAEVDTGELHERLKRIDSLSAHRIHPNDRKRITRALEVFHTTGKRLSDEQQQWTEGDRRYRHDPILIGLDWPTDRINRRINQRVRRMFKPTDGREDLVSETKRLDAAGLLGPQAREALGTKQVLAHLAGEYEADCALEKVKIQTRRFAKNQRTWLRRFRGVRWLNPVDREMADLIAEAVEIIRIGQSTGPHGEDSGGKTTVT